MDRNADVAGCDGVKELPGQALELVARDVQLLKAGQLSYGWG